MHWGSLKVAGRPNKGKRGRPTDRQALCEQGEDWAKRHTRITSWRRACIFGDTDIAQLRSLRHGGLLVQLLEQPISKINYSKTIINNKIPRGLSPPPCLR